MIGQLFTPQYPSPAFRFRLTFGLMPLLDTSFQEVSGIGTQMETEPVVEGGENRYVHTLPKSFKHSNLVLKRGIAALTSPLVLWCKATLEADLAMPVMTQLVLVSLLDESGLPLRVWTFENAYPVQWEVDPFNSTKNEVALEKVTLSYTGSMRML
ncbi:MAG: phage tail protein [Burkholderiales bacterium]